MKLFASDFDGTLFHRDPISLDDFQNPEQVLKSGYRQEDIDAIARFRNSGNLFGLCTGRSKVSASDFLPESIVCDFFISSSGAVIQDRDGQILACHLIDRDTAKKMLEILPETGLSITTTKNFYVSRDMAFLSAHPVFIEELDLDGDEEVICISSNLWDPSLASLTKQKLEELPGIQAYQNQSCLDCVSSACSKGTGVKEAARLLGVREEDTGAAGDSWNDLPMLEAAGTSFTFDDSPADVQEACTHVVHGIAQALELFETGN